MDFSEFEIRMNKTVEVFKQNLSEVRAGRANPAILNKVSVYTMKNYQRLEQEEQTLQY